MNIIDYLCQHKAPTNRDHRKYYQEIQQLAFNLVRYLKMNEDENEENLYQGNFNLTYLKENMAHEDFKMITRMFLKRIPIGEVKQMMEDWEDKFLAINKINKIKIEKGDRVKIIKGIFVGYSGIVFDIDKMDNERPVAVRLDNNKDFENCVCYVGYNDVEKKN